VRLSRVLLSSGLFGSALVVIGYVVDGKGGFEKTATTLVMPYGLLWLLLSGVVIQHLCARGLLRTFPLGILWVAITTASTSPLGDACLHYLENQEVVFRPDEDADLDVLVVLGGGTKQGPTRAQAASGGDRVVYAAQLYINGNAKRLITTGDAMPGFAGARSSPQQHTVEIWTELGIPRDAIGTLSGLNTYQEIQSLKAIMPKLVGQRVGLLTSASHLPRAMRLARAEGLTDLIPIAADYRFNVESYSYIDLIPNAGALAQLARCQHEFMAKFVGR
jgi:uncharacterized SAM-binding protein YcdF (DUF218 family)